MTGMFRNRGGLPPASGASIRAWPASARSAWRRLRVACLAACLGFWPLGAWAEYTLRPGDTVSVSTFGVFNIAHESVVDPDGNVTLPVAGRMAVAGLTLPEVQTQVAATLSAEPLRLVDGDGMERWLNLQASEILVEISSYAPVFVTGAVAQPGRIAYTPGMTVRQLVAEAGGLGMGALPDDADGRLSMQLAMDRDIAAERVSAVMSRVNRLREELLSISGGTPEPATVEAAPPEQAEEPAPAEEAAPAPVEEPTVELETPPSETELAELEALPSDEGIAPVRRPRARPTGDEPQEPEIAEAEGPAPALSLQIDGAPVDGVEELASEAPVEEAEPPARTLAVSASSDLQEVGRQLVEVSAAARGIDLETTRELLAEMDARLELLRRRQTDEEALVQHDREELARVQDLINRGLVPESEAAVAERALLLSSMQSYETADSAARLEIERARLAADLERQPSEAAQQLLQELEDLLAEAEVATAELNALDRRIAVLGGPTVTQNAVEYQFMLHRDDGDGTVAQPVGQDAKLMPGDVLDVVAILPDPTLTP